MEVSINEKAGQQGNTLIIKKPGGGVFMEEKGQMRKDMLSARSASQKNLCL